MGQRWVNFWKWRTEISIVSPLPSHLLPTRTFFASCLIGYKSQEILSIWCWSSCMQFSAPTFRTEHLKSPDSKGLQRKTCKEWLEELLCLVWRSLTKILHLPRITAQPNGGSNLAQKCVTLVGLISSLPMVGHQKEGLPKELCSHGTESGFPSVGTF